MGFCSKSGFSYILTSDKFAAANHLKVKGAELNQGEHK